MALASPRTCGSSASRGCARLLRPPSRGPSPHPPLVLWGDQDDVLDRAQEEDLARAIPGSRLVLHEGTGHLVLWEQHERVARDLADFMTSRLSR